MITINLLPEEFRIRKKVESNLPTLKIAIAAGAVFMIATVFFYFDYLAAGRELGRIEKEWTIMQPQSEALKTLEQEVEGTIKPERDFLNRFVTTQKPLTYLLMWASELLPETTWLLEVKVEQAEGKETLFIKGLTLPSKEKSSIEYIEGFLHALKEKIPEATLSLTTTRQTIEHTELTQFIANFEWKVSA